MQYQPVQLPVSQPLNPPMYGPHTNAPVMSAPGYAQVPMQPLRGNEGYPGAGGPTYRQPPMASGGRGGGGGKSRNKRAAEKRRDPIWAPAVTVIKVVLRMGG